MNVWHLHADVTFCKYFAISRHEDVPIAALNGGDKQALSPGDIIGCILPRRWQRGSVRCMLTAHCMQANTEGDLLSSVSISASGEAITFGGSGGYVHLWSRKDNPCINIHSAPLALPAVNSSTGTQLHEDESFAALPAYPSQEVALACRSRQMSPAADHEHLWSLLVLL